MACAYLECTDKKMAKEADFCLFAMIQWFFPASGSLDIKTWETWY